MVVQEQPIPAMTINLLVAVAVAQVLLVGMEQNHHRV
jgi:hypothetical protein